MARRSFDQANHALESYSAPSWHWPTPWRPQLRACATPIRAAAYWWSCSPSCWRLSWLLLLFEARVVKLGKGRLADLQAQQLEKICTHRGRL
ncbi:MAG: hypothetical protein ACKOPS_05190 [Cyanobium sp.]